MNHFTVILNQPETVKQTTGGKMGKKVVLFLVDGMRPDALAEAETPIMDKMMAEGCFTLAGQTVMPSITLPCHTSLFFSVAPTRHGILTNSWHPLARPLPGLFDQLHKHDLLCASFYNWEQLRDLSSPGALSASVMLDNLDQPVGAADLELTRVALDWLMTHDFDFAFIYLGQTDEVGHHENWMSAPYLESVAAADRCMGVVMESLPADVNYFVTADHGGHDQHHGTPMKVDMRIPILALEPDVPVGHPLKEDASIMDIAPTITAIFDIKNPRQWAGKALF